MRYQKKPRKGRAQAAPAELFERALLGADCSDRPAFNPNADRKTLQLCRQVQRALMLALAGECADEILRDVFVESVEPMGSASHLVVRVVLPASSEVSAIEVMARLEDRSKMLRALVARSISRKRVPGLSFVVVPASAMETEGGQDDPA